MPPAKALRHQYLDLLPYQFLSTEAKQLLHLRIDQDDPAGSIHHHQRVRPCFQQLSKLAIAIRLACDERDHLLHERLRHCLVTPYPSEPARFELEQPQTGRDITT